MVPPPPIKPKRKEEVGTTMVPVVLDHIFNQVSHVDPHSGSSSTEPIEV